MVDLITHESIQDSCSALVNLALQISEVQVGEQMGMRFVQLRICLLYTSRCV